MEDTAKIKQFLDDAGKITQLPRKQTARLAVLRYLAAQFERNRDYTEREVNAICDAWHTFNDYFLLRRELVDFHLLQREPDGSRYWRTADEPSEQCEIS